MSNSNIDFVNLFIDSPGDLLFFLGVLVVTQAALFIALGHRLRQPENPVARRYTTASIGIVLAWILLMFGALFSLISDQAAASILPPLERAVYVLVILIIGWAFLYAEREGEQRQANVGVLVALAVTIVAYIITGIAWIGEPDGTAFNGSSYSQIWSLALVVAVVVGIVLTIRRFRDVVDAPLKLVFFGVLLLGFGGTWLQISSDNLTGDYAGLSRLALMVALPVLPMVIYRMVIDGLEGQIFSQEEQAFNASIPGIGAPLQTVPPPSLQSQAPSPSTGRMAAAGAARESAQLMRALGVMLEDAMPSSIPQRIVSAAIEILRADVGALLTFKDANYADIVAAYDHVMERSISGVALNLEDQPTLMNAVERRTQRPIYPDRNGEELQDLYTRLDINQIGPTYFQPLRHGDELVAVLVVGLPYAARELREDERGLLSGMGVIAASLLALSDAANDAKVRAEERAIQAMIEGVSPDALQDDEVIVARRELQAELEASREQVRELTSQITRLKLELDEERERLSNVLEDTQEGKSISQRLIVLSEEQRALLVERDRLAARLQEAEATLAGATSDDSEGMYAKMLDVVRRERDELSAQRDRLQEQLEELRSDKSMPQMVQEILERITRDKTRLEEERDQLSEKLAAMDSQLRSIGLTQGTDGLTQLLSQLYQERMELRGRVETLQADRDMLAQQMQRLENVSREVQDYPAQQEIIQSELKHLAGDREAVTKLRDKLRSENDELQRKLQILKTQRTRLFAEAEGYRMELGEAHEEESRLHAQIQELSDERSELLRQRDQWLAERQRLEMEREQYLARIEGDRDRLQQLGVDGVGALTQMIDELTQQRNVLEQQLGEARTALAEVRNRLEILQVQHRAQTQVYYQPNDPELILGMVHELRTPMTSIVGYTELLLSDSAGFLGKMQRDFLHRVDANVRRLATMLDDLVQVTALDTGEFKLVPESFNIVTMIEDAITNSSSQFREKGLTLHLNLDDSLPSVLADPDAISQVIGQLLTNAYLVSPPDSEIIITAQGQKVNLSQNGHSDAIIDGLFVCVEDRGGGIAPEDEPRVFARKYKAENPLIEGLGDTGVGLAVACALVEAHGGKLWLETTENVGSKFSFILPTESVMEGEH